MTKPCPSLLAPSPTDLRATEQALSLPEIEPLLRHHDVRLSMRMRGGLCACCLYVPALDVTVTATRADVGESVRVACAGVRDRLHEHSIALHAHEPEARHA